MEKTGVLRTQITTVYHVTLCNMCFSFPPSAQPAETAELVEHLEDAQMALGGMASNRYAAPFREQVTAWLGKLDAVGEQVLPPLAPCAAHASLYGPPTKKFHPALHQDVCAVTSRTPCHAGLCGRMLIVSRCLSGCLLNMVDGSYDRCSLCAYWS